MDQMQIMTLMFRLLVQDKSFTLGEFVNSIYEKLVMLNEAGFSSGQILAYILMYFMLRRDLKKSFSEQFNGLVKSINNLVKEIHEIRTHVGLKKE